MTRGYYLSRSCWRFGCFWYLERANRSMASVEAAIEYWDQWKFCGELLNIRIMIFCQALDHWNTWATYNSQTSSKQNFGQAVTNAASSIAIVRKGPWVYWVLFWIHGSMICPVFSQWRFWELIQSQRTMVQRLWCGMSQGNCWINLIRLNAQIAIELLRSPQHVRFLWT